MLSENFPEALVINGDVTDEKIFDEEQIGTYDLIITTTNNQELNVLSALYAKNLGTNRAVSLVTKANYLNMATNLGIDATISPKGSTVDAIIKAIRRGNIKSVHSLFGDKAEVIQFVIDKQSSILNKSLREIQFPENSLILSVVRDNTDFIPDGNFEILEGDSVITIANSAAIPKLEEMFG